MVSPVGGIYETRFPAQHSTRYQVTRTHVAHRHQVCSDNQQNAG